MAYTFAAASGDTRSQLADRVLSNSFSSARYGEDVKAFLNDAVTDICRRLRFSRDSVQCAVVAGVVTQPTRPFFKVEGLWLAAAGGTAGRQLTPWDGEPDTLGVGLPLYYTARRALAPTSRYPQLLIELLPAPASASVIVAGLQRPAIMDDDADLTGLGADLDRAVIAFAKGRCFELEDDVDMATFWEAKYLDSLGVAAMEQVSDGPRVSPGTWGSGHPDRGR